MEFDNVIPHSLVFIKKLFKTILNKLYDIVYNRITTKVATWNLKKKCYTNNKEFSEVDI